MTASDIHRSHTSTRSTLELVRPTEGEATCRICVFIDCKCSIINDSTYGSHRAAAIYVSGNNTTADIHLSVTAHNTCQRVIIILTVGTFVGVRTTTRAIDITTGNLGLLSHYSIVEVIPRIFLIYDTYSTAIYVHRSILGIVTVLTTAIYGTLDVRTGGRAVRANVHL